MTDQQLEEKFREWFWEQYLTPPSVHAIRSHMAWARFLLGEQQQREAGR
jgi:hypothetical protein